jgi:ribosome assembly protein RRB1
VWRVLYAARSDMMARAQFPHEMTVVAGTQAAEARLNKLVIMKMSRLCRTKHDQDDENSSDDDDDASDEEDDDIDEDPILEHQEVKHPGGVNRVRCMPQQTNIVASWSDNGHAYVWDISGPLRVMNEVCDCVIV